MSRALRARIGRRTAEKVFTRSLRGLSPKDKITAVLLRVYAPRRLRDVFPVVTPLLAQLVPATGRSMMWGTA